jgi:transposase-like protein
MVCALKGKLPMSGGRLRLSSEPHDCAPQAVAAFWQSERDSEYPTIATAWRRNREPAVRFLAFIFALVRNSCGDGMA